EGAAFPTGGVARRSNVRMSTLADPATEFGLAPLQAGMLFQALLEHGSAESAGFDIQQSVLAIPEAVPLEALREAWKLVAARHPVLRASFAWEELPRPVMRIQAEVGDVVIEEHSWLGIDEHERRGRLLALLEADRKRGFDLRREPLDRFHVCRIAPERVVLVWSYHHILKDGRSACLVLDELVGTLRALRDGRAPRLRPAPRPFTEFAAWVNGRDSTRSRAFFRRLLQGKVEPTPLPGAERAALQVRGSGMRTRLLERRTSARLHTLARESGTTLGTVIQAAWSVFLARWTGDEDVLFGNTRACRKSALDGKTDDMVGMLVNTVPLRVRCSGERTLREVLRELRQLGLAMREHEHTPLVEAQAESEIRPGLPLFETVLMFESRELNCSMQQLDPWWERCPLETYEQPAPPLVLTA